MTNTRLMMLCAAVAWLSGCATTQTEPLKTTPGEVTQGSLTGKTIAIVATDGVEEVELVKPRQAFEAAGAHTVLIAPHAGQIQSFHHEDKADLIKVDATLAEANPASYDGLFLPGGTRSPDQLRQMPEAISFIRSFSDKGKPIAALCHGPWTLIVAGAVRGRTVTSWPSLKTDLTNAGATWVDQDVVVDGNLVTSRNPEDIPAFVPKAIDGFSGASRRSSIELPPAG